MKWIRWTFLFIGPTLVVIIVQTIGGIPLNTPLSTNLAGTLLATMAQVLAGILAIVFSVSVLAVTIASDRYTPRLFSDFRNSPVAWLTFLALLSCLIVAVTSIGVQTIPMFQWGFLFMTWFFIFCLLTLPYYFLHTLQLLDPRDLAERVKSKALQALKKQDKQKVLESITLLGDIAIKAFERKEDEITKKYLDTLQELQLALIVPDSTPYPLTEEKDISLAQFGFGIRSPILNQYSRIFKMAIVRNNEEFTRYVTLLLSVTIITLIEQGGSTEILKGIFQQYQEFIETAIENKDFSRFSLILSLRDAISPHSYTKVFNEEYLPICLGALIKTNEIIIVHQDFELWKKELRYFSSITLSAMKEMRHSLPGNFVRLLSELLRAGIPIDKNQQARWMMGSIDTWITHANKNIFELVMSEIEQFIPPSEQQLHEQAQRVKEEFQKLYATTAIYDVFLKSASMFFTERSLDI